MQDGYLSREELPAELERLRRKVEELESENARLKELGRGSYAAPANSPDLFKESSLTSHLELGESRDGGLTVAQAAEEALRQSRQRFRTLAEASFEGIAVSENGALLDVNHQLAAMVGYEPKELIGMAVIDLIAPEHRDLVVNAQTTGRLEPYEHLMLRKDGAKFPVEVRARHVHLEDREVRISAIRDITGRKRIEETLRRTNAALEALVKGSPVAIIAFDTDGQIQLWNPAAESMLGWSEAEVLGKSLSSLAEERFDEWQALGEGVLRGETIKGGEIQGRRKDGSSIDLSISAAPLHDVRGNINGVMTVGIDITERKQAEDKLRFTQYAIDNSGEAAYWIRSDGSHIYVNDAACRSLGYSKEELLGLSIQDIDPDYPLERWDEHWEVTKHHGNSVIETRHKRKDGRLLPVEVRINHVEFEGQEYHCSFASDITERKKAEQALLESMEKFRSIVENSLAGIFTIDDAYKFIYVNDELCRILGYSRRSLLGMDFRKVLTDEYRPVVVDRYIRRQRGEESRSRYELNVMRGDGRIRRVEMLVTVVTDALGSPRSMGQLIDITERKKTEESVRISRRRLSEALRVARMGSWEYDVLQDLFTFNDQYYSLHRMTASDAGGYHMSAAEFARKYVHPQDAAIVEQAIQRAVAAPTEDFQFQDEARILTANGESRWVYVWFRIEKDDRGRTSKMFGVNQDITERKQAEEALRQSEQNYRELVQNANSIILRWNRKGDVTFLNEYGQNFFGYAGEDIVGRHVIGTIVPETESGGRDLRPLMEQICSNPRAFEHNVNENMLQDGSRVWVEWTNKAVFDEQSQLVEIFSVGTDITERKRTENAIGNIVAGVSSKIGAKFFDSIASHFASTLGADCTIIGELIDGQEGERIKTLAFCLDGRVSDNITYPLEGSPCQIALQKGLWSSPRSVRRDFPHDVRLAELNAEGYVGVKLSDSSGLPLGVMAALYRSPITDVRFAESVLQIFAARTAAEIDRKRVEEDRLRLVSAIEQAGESILITDPAGKILYANPSFTETTGYSLEEALGQTPELLGNATHGESFYRDLWAGIKPGEVWRGRFTNKKKDGTLYEETASIAPIRDEAGEILNFVMVGRDVTSETMLQKQLNQAQKMEAIGTLAGGIAHDFNNLLQAILGYSDLLLMKKGRGDPERKKLEVIQRAARDGADLVARILTFSRKAESKIRPVDLNEVIRRAQRLLRRTVPRMIDIQLKLAGNLQVIDADPAQVEQVLLNLAINAHHAMPDGGKLLIETCNVVLKDEYLLTHLGARAGHYVLLTVSDTGAGMEPDVLDRIFEPFFTTKTNGEGTGLGLSMVHGIVSQHGGYIRCYSEPAIGTSFKIYLPISDSENYPDMAMTREMPAFGTETILLVDDDDRIRELGTQMVEMGGYRAVTARSGEEALEIYRAQKAAISLVILDLIMPGMGGNRCLEQLLRLDPEVRVLVASGYSPNGLTQAEKGRGARGFINKPYDAKDLLTAVRNILDRGHL